MNNEFCDCSSTATLQTIDTTTLIIPNIFSPNGDGINDIWEIKNIGYFPSCKVKVMKACFFSSTVFESTGYSTPWDGKENGKVKGGKYKYEISIGDKTFKGYVGVFGGKKFEASDFDCIFDCTPLDRTDPAIGH